MVDSTGRDPVRDALRYLKRDAAQPYRMLV